MAKSAAKTLGKKGGKATAQKRTKEQRSEAAKKAADARWETSRQDSTPNVYVFERILANDWFAEPAGAENRRMSFSTHRVEPLLSAGYAVLDREEERPSIPPHDGYTQIFYKHTESGLRWWYAKRLEIFRESVLKYPHLSDGGKYPYEFSPATFAERMTGVGIGSIVHFYLGGRDGPAVFEMLHQGLASFIEHRDYVGMSHGPNEHVCVALTKAGFDYFRSLPKTIEAWE